MSIIYIKSRNAILLRNQIIFIISRVIPTHLSVCLPTYPFLLSCSLSMWFVFVCHVCMCVCVNMIPLKYVGQRTTFRSTFSLSAMWGLESKLLAERDLTYEAILPFPGYLFIKLYVNRVIFYESTL